MGNVSARRAGRLGALVLAVACAGTPAPETGSAEPAWLDVEIPAEVDAGKGELDATLGFGGVAAVAELELSGRLPAAPAPLPRIEVHLQGDERLLGAERFSLRDPAAFRFAETAAIYAQLREEGVLVPRARRVRVRVNGEDRGVMIAVDHYAKELFESQRRREGVLFRLDEAALPVARVDAYGAKRIRKKRHLAVQRDTASGLLQAWLRGQLPAAQVFDVPLVAAALAVAEVWQADGLLRPADLRFYFNPVTQRIEPVALDAALRAPGAPREGVLVTERGWPAQLLADPEVRAAFDRALPRAARALSRRGTAAPGGLDAASLRAPWARRALDLSPASIRPAAPKPALRDDPDARALRANPVPSADLDSVLARHPRLRWDAAAGLLRAPAGRWDVEGSLVLPDGAGLALGPGTTLRFGPGAILVAPGPLRFQGTASEPVVLAALPAPAGDGTWGGIASLSSAQPHRWRHVEVRDTTGVDRDGWTLTGGVTLRKAEVEIATSEFRGNRAEDALNLISSKFAIRDVSFAAALSDAFDCDFCEGRISGGSFRGIGGDGLDVSGSDVEVEAVRFEEIGDKAISVGESSRLSARDVRVRNVRIGLAAKDASEVELEDSYIADARLAGIMAYVKKNEYGPGRVRARNVAMEGVSREVVVQRGSRVLVDGVEWKTEDVDVDALYRDERPAK